MPKSTKRWQHEVSLTCPTQWMMITTVRLRQKYCYPKHHKAQWTQRVHRETWDHLKHWFSWSTVQTHLHRQVPAVMWQASKLVWRLVNGKGERGRREKERKKRALTVISDSPLLSAPLPPCSTTYFLTALVRVIVLIHAQRNVYVFRNIFSEFKPQFIQLTSDYPSSISKT